MEPAPCPPRLDDMLLATKLLIPPMRPVVSRPRLIRRLNQGIGSKLILITAGAGFGKTTLLNEWARQAPIPVGWVSLDPTDDTPLRFWSYFIAALQPVRSGIGDSVLAALHNQPASPLEPALASLINQWCSAARDFALVLDDYHVIEAPEIHQGVAFLLDHAPPCAHLVISGRSEPPLHLARLRARREMVELHGNDLRFATEEAASFLKDIMGLDLSPDQVAALCSHTEGWAAGLQLTALSVQDREGATDLLASVSNGEPLIMEYLAEEVLRLQPDVVQQFLLQTSVLKRMSGPLCDTVTGQKNGRAMLERLVKANLFIEPLDDCRQWYSYHPLFADLLRGLLAGSDADLAALRLQASRWCERNGCPAEAIEYALAGTDYARAADLIERHARSLIGEGEVATVMSLIDALPADLVCARPVISMHCAWTSILSGYRFEVAEAYLQHVDRAIGSAVGTSDGLPTTNAYHDLLGRLSGTRAYILRLRGDLPGAITQAKRALELLTENDAVGRWSATHILAQAYRYSGDTIAWSEVAAGANLLNQGVKSIGMDSTVLDNKAELELSLGRLHRAAAIWQSALALAAQYGGANLPATGNLHLGLAIVFYQWNDLAAAFGYVKKGIELAQRGNLVEPLLDGYLTLAQIQHAQQRTSDAWATLNLADQLIQQQTPTIKTIKTVKIVAYRARLRLTEDQREAALQWVRASGIAAADTPIFAREFEHLTLARILLATNRAASASGLLANLKFAAERGGRITSLLEILILQALAFQAQGETGKALTALEHALRLAEPEGFLRVFLDEGPPMAALLNLAAGRGLAPGFVARLLAAFPSPEALPTGEADYEPFSERELQVLRLLMAQLTSTEIAQELGIATDTARTHIKRIYRKLSAHDRAEAVERARSLGLLPKRG